MERDDRPTVGTFFSDAALASRTVATLGERAAHHARVKRLSAGDVVRLTDGAGHLATGSIRDVQRASLQIGVDGVDNVERSRPIHLRVPVADRDRMLWLAEKATELGISTWQVVRFRRSMSVTPRGEGAAFREKVRARMVGALEQSGGAWLPELLPDTTPDALVVGANELAIVLDLAGTPLPSIVGASTVDAAPVLVFGPEGGMDPSELATLIGNGWQAARLADTILRFETAGIAGIAVIRAAQLREN